MVARDASGRSSRTWVVDLETAEECRPMHGDGGSQFLGQGALGGVEPQTIPIDEEHHLLLSQPG